MGGRIPAEIGNLIHLQELSLSSNALSGRIPAEVGNLINLKELDLYFNKLSGIIPESMKKLSAGYVNISENYFMKDDNIPRRWRCDKAFRKRIEPAPRLEEGMKALFQKLLGDSGRVNGALL